MKQWKMVFFGLILFIPSGASAYETERISGYKGARWGMSPVQVKKVLNLKVAKTAYARSSKIPYKNSDYVGFNFGGSLILECWFYHGKLYRVRHPFKAGDIKTYDVRMAREDKYGKPAIVGAGNIQTKECDAKGDDTGTECFVWNAGISRITLWGGMTGLSKGYARNVDYEEVISGQKARDEVELKKHKKEAKRAQ